MSKGAIHNKLTSAVRRLRVLWSLHRCYGRKRAVNLIALAGDIMRQDVIFALVSDDQEKVANLARKYNLNSVPVVDEDDRLVGVATIDDIVDVISEEADEDIYRIAGTAAHFPFQQRVLRRAFVRIPWLFFPALSGFVVALVCERIVAAPGARQSLTLFGFIPLVMGISGGVGIQSSTLMARGLATGEIDVARMYRVFQQEVVIGVGIAAVIGGLVMAVLYGAMSIDVIDDTSRLLPLAVGAGLIVGIVLATITGTVFPLACHFIRLDPALVAGPFVTSVNDVAAALSYLFIAHLLLH